MDGSTITHFFDSDDCTNDIEMLPSPDSMVDVMAMNQQKPKVPKSVIKHIRKRSKKKMNGGTVPVFGRSDHLERANVDIRNLSLSIAGNIDTQEQWKEFFDDSQGEGLVSILQCIRDCAQEIKLGSEIFDADDDISVLDVERRRENAFHSACRAVKTLRDLSSIDKYWAAFITDEILQVDQRWRKEENDGGLDSEGKTGGSNGFLDDLTVLHRYNNELDTFYNRRVKMSRRDLRNHGITIKRFGTRKQRRGKFLIIF